VNQTLILTFEDAEIPTEDEESPDFYGEYDFPK